MLMFQYTLRTVGKRLTALLLCEANLLLLDRVSTSPKDASTDTDKSSKCTVRSSMIVRSTGQSFKYSW